MKIKIDFVTNSSSASFIMYIISEDMHVDEFKTKLRNLLPYITYSANDIDKCGVEKVAEGVFTVSSFTSMYNNTEDIPDFMRSMLLEWYMNKHFYLKNGIKDLSLKIEDDHF